MTTEQPHMSIAEDEPPLVGDVWQDVLVEFGFDRDRAEQITRLTLGQPELLLSHHEREEILEIIKQELNALDFESEIGSESDRLRNLLSDLVELGLDGILLGPSSAPSDIAYSGTDSLGVAFDGIRYVFQKADVEMSAIDMETFPTSDRTVDQSGYDRALEHRDYTDETNADEEMTASVTKSYTKRKSFATSTSKSNSTDDGVDKDKVEIILNIVHRALDHHSVPVRKQAVKTIASVAHKEVRSDLQIQALVRAYEGETDPEVQAAIIEGLGAYLGAELTESNSNGDSSSSETDPRTADTGLFSDSFDSDDESEK